MFGFHFNELNEIIYFKECSAMFSSKYQIILIIFLLSTISMYSQTDYEKSQKTEIWEPVPEIISPGDINTPPSDAIILLGQNGISEWEHEDGSSPKWNYSDGVLTVVDKTGLIKTKRKFGSCQLHIEWRAPIYTEEEAKKEKDSKSYLEEKFNGYVIGEGQGRGNSGVFLMERYEVQILDSYNNRTYSNGQAGSIYKQHIPLVNACKGPGEWQTYDIIFEAPKFEKDGTLITAGYFTVLHNGVLIQNHAEIKGNTVWIGEPYYEFHSDKESISLQDHGNPVSFRNIWVREL
ncbi:MAG: DUF1080 domain-containing protein [Melioribacteraceae bacterium]|nr:DUF1080 domain-containing protein [Melioribacteraceae bacterium]